MKIGNLNFEKSVFLAPMAGVTDISFRGLCKEMGCGLVYTEMVSAKALYYGSENTQALLRIADEEKPVAAQIFGNDPKIMAEVVQSHFNKLDDITKNSGTIGLISVGWDPGLFSLNRLLGQAVLPNGKDYTFWGKGVSQGHSDAIRRIEGVEDGVQYTVPIESAINMVRTGKNVELSAREKHERVCYIVPKEDADLEYIKNEIINMPNYFAEYNTTVNFITEEEMNKNHKGMPHGGFVIRTGVTGEGTNQRMEFSLKLDSNPEFTSSVLVAYARAVYRLHKEGQKGARTVLDIPFSYLSPKSGEELRKELL